MKIFSINGTGLRFYGISNPDQDGRSSATVWVTFFFFPLIPVRRVILTRKVTLPRDFVYTIHEKQSLRLKEIASTWMWGLIIVPVLLLAPLVLCIREVATAIGIPTDGNGFGLYETLILFSIVYLVVFVWKWKDWIDRRGLPQNYRQILSQPQPPRR